tara:strand:+ start:26 stop:460 length:435 start_codon:yes stop_codon:yes gene_type:complete
MITIYTDGACSGNPGIGGWGIVIINQNKKPIYLNGGNNNTTNNRMELTAAINALRYFEKKENLEIFTDSKYVKDGTESWINRWKLNDWKTSAKKPVKNKDLWIDLDKYTNFHNVKWNWVKGHSNDRYNEKADFLARQYIEENKI